MKTRLFLVLVMTLVAIRVEANNLILIPTGTTLSTGQFRAEGMMDVEGRDVQFFQFAAGLRQYEFNLTRYQAAGRRTENLAGLQWNFLPETYITPAIGIGVRDIGSQSVEGFGAYGAITKRLPILAFPNYLESVSLTVGVGIKSMRGLFGGVEVKFPLGLFAQGEYINNDWNGALGIQVAGPVRLKYYSIRRERYVGAEVIPLEF